MTPQLCIGTAQFGLNYGITNSGGKLSDTVASQILVSAVNEKIQFVDTAHSYGVAESVIGRSLPDNHCFRFISKFPPQIQDKFSYKDVEVWERQFYKTLTNIGIQRLDGYLVHSIVDLHKSGAHFLVDWLKGLRQRGLVGRLGLSIYCASDLEGIDLSLLDLVQAKINQCPQGH